MTTFPVLERGTIVIIRYWFGDHMEVQFGTVEETTSGTSPKVTVNVDGYGVRVLDRTNCAVEAATAA